MELKRAKVVMLPTDRKSTLYTLLGNQLPTIYIGDYDYSDGVLRMNQHLYIITDEEIKEGDWCILFKDHKNYLFKALPIDEYNNCKKIVATTDTKLYITIGEYYNAYNKELPKPSQAFIEKYCKVGGIDEVNVEYECTHADRAPNGIDCGIKINSHNEITIHPIKDSWTRKEVIELINKHRKETYNGYSSKKWIKENL